MFVYAVCIGISLFMMSLLLSDRKKFLHRGMSEAFYNVFAVSYACFIVSCFISWIATMCFFALFSLAAPILCFNRFKDDVWRIDKYSYILAGVSIGTLFLLAYQLINYCNKYPDYDYSFLLLLVFVFSTPSFYFVTCRRQLAYMKETDEEMAVSSSNKKHGSGFYLLPFFIVTIIVTIFFDSDFEDICKERIYQKGRIYFCAEITDVAVTTYYGSKGRRNLEYEVTTDYILPNTKKPYIFTELGESGSVDQKYHYQYNPEKFGKSPYLPKKKIIIERSYFDKRVFTVVNKHPSAKAQKIYQRPVVEIDSKRHFLDKYADINFLKENWDFYRQYCGINFVVKAIKVDEINGMNIYDNPLLNQKISYYSKSGNNLDTLLFFKTLSDSELSGWICLNSMYQTQENRSKISDCGIFFHDTIWCKEEFQSQISDLQMLLQ